MSKIRDSHIVERLILRHLTFFIAFYFKTEHSNSLQTFAIFYPKWRNMTSLKVIFQKFLDGFYEILEADVKLMLGTVLKVSRRHLPPFLSYRENPTGGGGICPPPPHRGVC